MFKYLIFPFFAVSISCSNNAEVVQESTDKNPSTLAQSAANAYRLGVKKTHELVQSGKVEQDELDKLFDGLKSELTQFGKEAESLQASEKSIYQQKYLIEAYDGLDSVAIAITTFKDSLKLLDPNDTRVIQLEGIMSLSVYADFDQLRRIYPSKHAELTRSQN